MRDIVLFAVVFGLIPYILRHPYIGVLAWSWLSYMNPHKLTWGPAFSFPFAQLVALTLFVSLLLDKEKKSFPMNGLVVLWLSFLVWNVIATTNALYPEAAWEYQIQVFKIQIILFLAMWIMYSDQRIKLMLWVMFFSIGFFGIKGGVFTLMTGGGHRIYGPAGTHIADNNHLAVAMLMVIPLGFYLRKHELKLQWQKHAMSVAIVLILVSVIGSHSRGAFLAIGAVAIYLWWKTPNKIISGTLGAGILAVALMFMPQHYWERMDTINTYEEDSSAMSRINVWVYTINVANDRLTGGGFSSYNRTTFARWAPNPDVVFVPHSIYFKVLGDNGWPGLILYFSLFWGGWRMASRIARGAQKSTHEDAGWTYDMANMIKVSIVAYAVGGAFLNLAYFDLPWHLLAIIILLERSAREKGLLSSKGLSYAEQRKRAAEAAS